MRCPSCGERETRVVDSRDLDDSATIPRRRECSACARAVHHLRARRGRPAGRHQARRLTPGVRPRPPRLGPAQARRPVPAGPRMPPPTPSRPSCAPRVPPEIPSSRVGAMAMEQLRAIDQIGYIRFASVPRAEDLEAPKRGRPPLRGARDPRRLRRVSVLSTATSGRRSSRARSASIPTTPRTCSPRRSTCTLTAASASSATTATRTSTSGRRSPT